MSHNGSNNRLRLKSVSWLNRDHRRVPNDPPPSASSSSEASPQNSPPMPPTQAPVGLGLNQNNYLQSNINFGPQSHEFSLPRRMVIESESESDSQSDSSEGSDSSVRQTTRANTMYNRQRYSDSMDTSSSTMPSITVSHHPEVSAYSNLMDIGSKVSGGLAPGGSEHMDYDPLNEEYIERRNRLLSSVGVRSQPGSPELSGYDDPRDIPLQNLSQQPPPMVQQGKEDTAAQAEYLRKKLELSQIQRQRKVNNIIESRKAGDSTDSDDHKSTSSSNDDTQSMQNDKAELKRLEEKMRLNAEEHAKQLVRTHIGQNLLHPSDAHDGYVTNQDLSMHIGLDDDDELTQLSHSSTNEDIGNTTKVSEMVADDGKEYNSSDSSSDSENEETESQKHAKLRGDPDYVPPPKKVREGVLGSLLKLYAQDEEEELPQSPSTSEVTSPSGSSFASPVGSPFESPGSQDREKTPDSTKKRRPNYFRTYSSEAALGREGKSRPKWYKSSSTAHVPSLSRLASSGLSMASDAANTASSAALYAPHLMRKPLKRNSGSGKIPTMGDLKNDFGNMLGPKSPDHKEKEKASKEAKKKKKKEHQLRKEKEKALKRARLAEQARITVHIADLLQRQRFLLRLGRALMLFGAPSHRLEEYLKITARVLEIDAQVLYIPGCMLVSFGDNTTHTSETKLLRVTQGLNLHKLHATHILYKEVVHDIMGLEEASSHIDHLLESGNLYPWWLVVIFYGLSCASFGMFAYGGYWPDLPMMFIVSCAVGFLQFWVQPRSDLYANVFEVTSSIVVSFLGRAIGSIGKDDSSRVFCFAAIAQGSLSLILPGYIILVGALELQTKNLVAGSVRMFYANIYSLFLSFGITLGSAIYGWIDRAASGETKCRRTVSDYWKILFVPSATVFIAMVNQASPRQLPVMVLVGAAGYAVLFFVQQQVKNASSFTSAIGAFTVGILGNLYSRVGHGLAFAAMLPGIFSLVPSSVAAQGSLVAGVAVADAIVNSDTEAQGTSAATAISELGATMTQVAVGIVVGLFAATLVVYPLGFRKKRSGLFTF